MSRHGDRKKGVLLRLVQALSLAVVFAIMYGATHLAAGTGGGMTVAAVGFLLLAGVLSSELCDLIGLPHLTGYLLAGIVAGPYVLHLVDHRTVGDLQMVNTLALALIALAGGAELRIEHLKRNIGSLMWSMLLQSLIVFGVTAVTFVALSRMLPFVASLGWSAVVGAALLWGTMAVSRSPSACLGILSQTRAVGPVAQFSLAFVMASDVVVVMMLALAMMIARPLIESGAELSVDDLTLVGHEVVGSIALGTTFGLLLAGYLRLVGRQLLVVLIAVGFGLTEVLRYLHFDPLLTFMLAGFVVQNASSQGEKLIHATEETGSIVYVVFFATAGAHLDIPLLRLLWPAALALAATRALATWYAHRLATRLSDDPPVVRRWGWSGLISQAGLTLGLSVIIARAFPTFGEGFRSLAIATIAINELIGPVLFKLGIDRAGENRPDVARRSTIPAPAPS
jgi:Kef-type K+ transport system membrane component KefB